MNPPESCLGFFQAAVRSFQHGCPFGMLRTSSWFLVGHASRSASCFDHIDERDLLKFEEILNELILVMQLRTVDRGAGVQGRKRKHHACVLLHEHRLVGEAGQPKPTCECKAKLQQGPPPPAPLRKDDRNACKSKVPSEGLPRLL